RRLGLVGCSGSSDAAAPNEGAPLRRRRTTTPPGAVDVLARGTDPDVTRLLGVGDDWRILHHRQLVVVRAVQPRLPTRSPGWLVHGGRGTRFFRHALGWVERRSLGLDARRDDRHRRLDRRNRAGLFA